MLKIEIPGGDTLQAEWLLLDFNGTLAQDGRLLPGVGERLRQLATFMKVVVLTADTFGGASEELKGLPLELRALPAQGQDAAKRDAANEHAGGVFAIGNGCNDALMLAAADLGLCVIQAEGAATDAMNAADVVCTSILAALDLLLHPKRLQATLRR